MPPQTNRHEREALRPLPMRISQHSYERLERIRDLDDVPIQEHVRRALDYYLDHVETSVALAASAALRQASEIVKSAHVQAGGALPAPSLVPDLLAAHAPRPQRSAPPKIVAK